MTSTTSDTNIDALLSPASSDRDRTDSIYPEPQLARDAARASLTTLDDTRYSIIPLSIENNDESGPNNSTKSLSLSEGENINPVEPASSLPTNVTGHSRKISKEVQDVLQSRFEQIQIAESRPDLKEEEDIDWGAVLHYLLPVHLLTCSSEFWGAVMAGTFITH